MVANEGWGRFDVVAVARALRLSSAKATGRVTPKKKYYRQPKPNWIRGIVLHHWSVEYHAGPIYRAKGSSRTALWISQGLLLDAIKGLNILNLKSEINWQIGKRLVGNLNHPKHNNRRRNTPWYRFGLPGFARWKILWFETLEQGCQSEEQESTRLGEVES